VKRFEWIPHPFSGQAIDDLDLEYLEDMTNAGYEVICMPTMGGSWLYKVREDACRDTWAINDKYRTC
jgi:hypothetical protein